MKAPFLPLFSLPSFTPLPLPFFLSLFLAAMERAALPSGTPLPGCASPQVHSSGANNPRTKTSKPGAQTNLVFCLAQKTRARIVGSLL